MTDPRPCTVVCAPDDSRATEVGIPSCEGRFGSSIIAMLVAMWLLARSPEKSETVDEGQQPNSGYARSAH